MSLEQLTEFFKWMTIINIGVLLFSTFMIILLKDVVIRMHSKMFGIGEDKIPVVIYSYLGMLKIFVIIFSLVPYVSLLILQ